MMKLLCFSRWWIAAAVAGIVIVLGTLVACGGGAGSGGPPPVEAVNMSFPGMAVVKTRSLSTAAIVLEEKLGALGASGPIRRLTFARDNSVTARYMPPAGWMLLDFAVHPSQEVSVLLATDKTLKLVRLDNAARPLGEQPLLDPLAPHDPADGITGVIDPESMLPVLSKDAARLAPLGEDLAVALRTGLNAVVAYRYRYGAGAFVREWRTLVEPGMTLLGRFLTSGSHDVFDQLVNHVNVFLDTDAAGTLVVGVPGGAASDLFGAHAQHFGEPIDATFGALVTLVSPTGQRLGTTVIDTPQLSELHGLRATPAGYALVGRVRTERRPDGGGWDAYAALLSPAGAMQQFRVIDIDRSDVLFDIVSAGAGRYLAAGATAYTQNPAGASISEQAQPLLLSLGPDLAPAQRLAVAAGPRHNQMRSLAARDRGWLAGGLQNGPGTHSGDDNPALIVADGVLREIALP